MWVVQMSNSSLFFTSASKKVATSGSGILRGSSKLVSLVVRCLMGKGRHCRILKSYFLGLIQLGHSWFLPEFLAEVQVNAVSRSAEQAVVILSIREIFSVICTSARWAAASILYRLSFMGSFVHASARSVVEIAVANVDERSGLLICGHLGVGCVCSKQTLQ